MSMYRMLLRYIDTIKSARPTGGVERGVAARNRSHSAGARIVRGCALPAASRDARRASGGRQRVRGRVSGSGNACRATDRRQSRSAGSSSSASQTRALSRRLDMFRTAGTSAPRTTPSTVQGDHPEPPLEPISVRLHRTTGFGPIHDPVVPGVQHRAAEGSAARSSGCVMTGTQPARPSVWIRRRAKSTGRLMQNLIPWACWLGVSLGLCQGFA